MNKTYQDHNLKIGVKKNSWKWLENIDADMWPLFYHSDMHFLTAKTTLQTAFLLPFEIPFSEWACDVTQVKKR